MTDAIRRLIDASSLGTPGARALRDSVSDDVARRIVERSEQIRDAIHDATPCDLWYCPTAERIRCGRHPAADGCCDQPDLHQRIYALTTEGEPDVI